MGLPAAWGNMAVEGWMTRFQVAHHEKLPMEHPLMMSKLASLTSQAHPQQKWRDAWGDGVLLQGQHPDSGLCQTRHGFDNDRPGGMLPRNTQAACSTPAWTCRHHPRPLRMESYRKKTKAACCQMM